MQIQVIRIDIFISSPGDLSEERRLVRRVIEKLNRGSLRDRYFFVPFLFEDEVPPEIGENAQLIVDRYMQVQNSYILISMFWTRMGTPFTIVETEERYESGTQYEFLKGYEHFKKKKQPHILLYRKQKENPKADPIQKQKVESFFDSFIGDSPKLVGLFTKYDEPTEFEEKVEEHIIKIIEKYPPRPENSNLLEPPEFKEEPRRIDAAMPSETAVGESTPVQVMICLPDSEGLKAFLPKKADRDEIKKEDVKAGGLTIAFEVDKKTGKVKPAFVTIELEADDFSIETSTIKVQLNAGNDSGQFTFNVIPLNSSRKSIVFVRVKSKALDGSEIECGSVVLSTKVKATKNQMALQMIWNLVTLPLAAASVSEEYDDDVDDDEGGRGGGRIISSVDPQGPGRGRPGGGSRGGGSVGGEFERSNPLYSLGEKSGKFLEIEGIGPVYANKLKKAGISSTNTLLKLGGTAAGRKELAAKSGLSERLILEWINHIDLFRIRGVGEEYADLLEEAGVDTVPELANRNAANLYAKMTEVNARKNLVRKLPSLSQVEDWINQAKKLPRAISY